MSVEFSCPTCQKQYRVADRFAGKKAACKGCGTEMKIPALINWVQTATPVDQPADTATPAPLPPPLPVIRLPKGIVECVHCHRPNPAGTSFCTGCGQALPAEMLNGPRVVSGIDSPTTDLGRSVVSDELAKQASKACWILLTLAVANAILTPSMLSASLRAAQLAHPNHVYFIRPIAYATGFAVSAAFWILFVWAMRNPLPATIVGLVLYSTLFVVNLVYEIGGASSSVNVTASVVAWTVRAIVISLLVRAIQAGLKHRRLLRESTPEVA